MLFWIRVILAMSWVFFVGFWALLFSPILFPLNAFNTFLTHVIPWGVFKILRIQLEIRGGEHIPRKNPFSVVMINHQSSLDLITFGSVSPRRFVVIGKKEIRWIPIIGWFWILGGNLSIDRGNPKDAIAKFRTAANEMKKRGLMVVMCPEGTRNKTGIGLLPFKKGGFHLAVQAQAPILPSVCTQVKRVFDFPGRKIAGGKLIVEFLPQVSTTGMTEANVDALCDSVRAQMLSCLTRLENEL